MKNSSSKKQVEDKILRNFFPTIAFEGEKFYQAKNNLNRAFPLLKAFHHRALKEYCHVICCDADRGKQAESRIFLRTFMLLRIK
jgi:hypothetical protein